MAKGRGRRLTFFLPSNAVEISCTEVTPSFQVRAMNSLFVADIGNSRIKWGRCMGHAVTDMVALSLEDTTIWEAQWQAWQVGTETTWFLGGVNPPVQDRLASWLQQRGVTVRVVEDYRQLSISVRVDVPEKVGLDRLFNALALQARPYRERGRPTIIVCAGSAVTVDLVDEAGDFLGGAIFPGVRLMALALQQFTAKLPLLEVRLPLPTAPGKSTEEAIQIGLHGAVVGGIERLCRDLGTISAKEPRIYLTGGDSSLLEPFLSDTVITWPEMTLEGLRIAAMNSHVS